MSHACCTAALWVSRPSLPLSKVHCSLAKSLWWSFCFLLIFKHLMKIVLCSSFAQQLLFNTIKTSKNIFNFVLIEVMNWCFSLVGCRPTSCYSLTVQVSACFTHAAPLRSHASTHHFINSSPAASPVPRHFHRKKHLGLWPFVAVLHDWYSQHFHLLFQVLCALSAIFTTNNLNIFYVTWHKSLQHIMSPGK